MRQEEEGTAGLMAHPRPVLGRRCGFWHGPPAARLGTSKERKYEWKVAQVLWEPWRRGGGVHQREEASFLAAGSGVL